MTPPIEENEKLASQKEFVKKVKDLSSALIEYKCTRDELNQHYDEVVNLKNKSRGYFDLITKLKESVLKEGLNLGLSEEMVIGMVIDMTKSQLTEHYVRKLLSEHFNRRMLATNSENKGNTHNEANKGTEKNSTVTLPQSNDDRNSSTPTPESPDFESIKEVETIELDLKQALEMGLKEHLDKCENSKSASYIVKLFVKDCLLKRIESELTL